MPRLDDLPAGLAARPLRDDDLDAVLALLNALEVRQLGEPLADRADLAAEWSTPGFTPREDGIAVHDAGRVVGAGLISGRGAIELHSTLDAVGLGLLPRLLGWAVARARERAMPAVSAFIAANDDGRRAVLADQGFALHHTSWILRIPSDAGIRRRELPPGYAVRAFTPGDAEAVHTVIEDAFESWEGRGRHTFEEWAAVTIRRPDVDPGSFLVGTFDGSVVGACIVLEADGETWVHQLAVDHAHRGHGLAQQLLAEAFAAGRERGHSVGGLATDSRTGALGLYERLGMRVHHTFENHSLRLAEG